MADGPTFFAEHAWVGGAWARDVLLGADAQGAWIQVQPDCSTADRVGAEVLAGPVLPGVVNAHSHAFQRAIAGLTERSAAGHDDFWSWRDRMYAAALRISPEQLEAVATFLYTELLRGGYTQVCEFHYLHNAPDGQAYTDPAEMSLALVRSAQKTGIGLTLLPTLYMRSGFGAAGLRDDQRRFASTPESVLRIAETVRKVGASPRITAGVALHSLRAVDEGALRETVQAARAAALPVHIHIAEQQQEVDDCVRHHGRRPIEWLLEQAELDASWNLVHATQATASELQALQRTGASIVLCPGTEANLGDGVFDLPAWLGAGGRWSVGSDSHVCRSWTEELRLLEYSQRFVLRQRNVASRSAQRESTAAVLLEGALHGGTPASGVAMAGIAIGQQADFSILDADASSLAGIPAGHLLDALIFSSPDAGIQRTFVASHEVATRYDPASFKAAMRQLWPA